MAHKFPSIVAGSDRNFLEDVENCLLFRRDAILQEWHDVENYFIKGGIILLMFHSAHIGKEKISYA